MTALQKILTIFSLLTLTLVNAASIIATPPMSQSPGTVDGSFFGLSIEKAYWTSFVGTADAPNKFWLGLIDLITERTEKLVNIRPGGNTQDQSTFVPDQPNLNPTYTVNEKNAIDKVTYGEAYFKSFANFKNGTRFVVTLNFGGNDEVAAQSEAWAAASIMPKDQILAFELGNEPAFYPSLTSTADYISRWNNFTALITANLTPIIPTPMFWGSSSISGGVNTVPSAVLNTTAGPIIDTGIVDKMSVHSYPMSSCGGGGGLSYKSLMNHTNIFNGANNYVKQVVASEGAKLALVIGEFNSISCSGLQGATDTYAQALWTLDRYMAFATINAKAVYLHQGAVLVGQSGGQANTGNAGGAPKFSYYNFAYPMKSDSSPQEVKPAFLGLLAAAEAVGMGTVRIDHIASISSDTLGGYAIYDMALSTTKPTRIVLISFAETGSMGDVIVDLSAFTAKMEVNIGVLKSDMSNEGDVSKISLAAQDFSTGKPVGDGVWPSMPVNAIPVGNSEAVIAYLITPKDNATSTAVLSSTVSSAVGVGSSMATGNSNAAGTSMAATAISSIASATQSNPTTTKKACKVPKSKRRIA